jgi:hypothetical protein
MPYTHPGRIHHPQRAANFPPGKFQQLLAHLGRKLIHGSILPENAFVLAVKSPNRPMIPIHRLTVPTPLIK